MTTNTTDALPRDPEVSSQTVISTAADLCPGVPSKRTGINSVSEKPHGDEDLGLQSEGGSPRKIQVGWDGLGFCDD